jgi:hypothetical protein
MSNYSVKEKKAADKYLAKSQLSQNPDNQKPSLAFIPGVQLKASLENEMSDTVTLISRSEAQSKF